MSVVKVRSSSTADAMKFEGRSPFDNFITQATGKEPYLSFTRANDTAMPWYQLFSPFEQQSGNKISKGQKNDAGVTSTSGDNGDTITSLSESVSSGNVCGSSTKMTRGAVESSLKIPEAVVAFAQAAAKANGEPEKYLSGWPLLPPSKVQMQKCAKCSREFCSLVNYKRHIRTHRKSNIYEKVSPKTREFLAAFWDKISADEAREIVSFEDSGLKLEGVDASAIIEELALWIRKPGFSYLPQVYVKAGITLLDVIQAKPSRFPISSQDFFNVLDDASEKTFLCAGTASSLQKFLFDGDVKKIALDMKNLVACASLLLEQKLVKAWHADKDVEALRCQKLLVEEEEAAQKRQAELIERRRRKKLRQKEQKVKDLGNGNAGVKDSQEACDSSSFVELLTPRASSDVELDSEASSASSQLTTTVLKVETDEGQPDSFNDHIDQNSDQQTMQVNGQWEVRTILNPRNSPSVFHSSQIAGVKCSLTEKNYVIKNSKAISSNGGQKVWTRKIKQETQEMSANVQSPSDDGTVESPKPTKKPAVLIGTISVSLSDCICSNDKRNPQSDLLVNSDQSLNHASRSMVKLWRPVSRQSPVDSPSCYSKAENGDVCNESSVSFQTNGDCNEDGSSSALYNSCSSDGGADDICSGRTDSSMVESSEPSAPQLFSSQIAEAFLKQRWEQAIASDHVKLVLTSDVESMDCSDTAQEEGNCSEMDVQTSHYHGHESHNGMPLPVQQAGISGAQGTQFKPKTEKLYRVEYVPKQRNNEIER